MKEVLTKKFWQDVKTTFEEALAESPPAETTANPPSPKDEPAPPKDPSS